MATDPALFLSRLLSLSLTVSLSFPPSTIYLSLNLSLSVPFGLQIDCLLLTTPSQEQRYKHRGPHQVEHA